MRALLILALVFVLSGGLTGCTAPGETLSLDEQKAFQVQQGLDSARRAAGLFEVYIELKKDEWPVEKYDEYIALLETAKAAIEVGQQLFDENDLLSAESQQIVIDGLIEEIKRRKEET